MNQSSLARAVTALVVLLGGCLSPAPAWGQATAVNQVQQLVDSIDRAPLDTITAQQTARERARPPVIHHFGSGEPANRQDRSQYFGGVTCLGGVPTIFYDHVQNTDSLERAENVRHEVAHFVQLAAGDCATTIASWIASPRAWISAEMQAFCLGIAQLPPPVRNRREIEYLLLFGGPRRPYGVSFEDVSHEIHRWCDDGPK